MPLHVRCPNDACGQVLAVQEALAGKQVHCPTCGTLLLMPAPSSALASSLDLQVIVDVAAKVVGVLCLALLLLAMFLRWHLGAGVREFSLLFFLCLLMAGTVGAALARPRWLAPAALVVSAFGTFVLFVAVAGLLCPTASLAVAASPPTDMSGPSAPSTPPVVSAKPVSQDLLVVLNTADGMQHRLESIKKGIESLARHTFSTAPESRVGLVTFHDRLEAKPLPPEPLTFEREPFTSKPAVFSEAVGRLTARGGGDEPESSLDALALAASQPFRANADRVLILITDASPKLPDKEMRSIEQVIEVLKDKKIKQLHLVVRDQHRGIYERLRTDAAGMTFSLGAGEQAFAQLLPQVGAQIAKSTRLALPDEEQQPSIDVMFALDVTGSMQFAINGVKRNISAFAQELFARNLDARIGLIGFRDQFDFMAPVFEVMQFPKEPALRRPAYNRIPEFEVVRFGDDLFARTSEKLRDGLQRLQARTRAGAPQSSLDALALAASQPIREKTERVLVLITDSPPRVPDDNMRSAADLINLLRAQRITHLHLIVSGVDRTTYGELHKGAPGHLLSLDGEEPQQTLERLLRPATHEPEPWGDAPESATANGSEVAGPGLWLAFVAALGLAASFLVLGLCAPAAPTSAPWSPRITHGGAVLLGLLFLLLTALGRG